MLYCYRWENRIQQLVIWHFLLADVDKFSINKAQSLHNGSFCNFISQFFKCLCKNVFYSLTATRGLEKCEKLTRLEILSYISGHTLICGCPVGISFYRKWWDIAVAQRRWISLCHPSLGLSGSDDKSVFDFFFCCDSQQLPPHLWLSPSRSWESDVI